jgi:hypothetical protein
VEYLDTFNRPVRSRKVVLHRRIVPNIRVPLHRRRKRFVLNTTRVVIPTKAVLNRLPTRSLMLLAPFHSIREGRRRRDIIHGLPIHG